MNKDKITIAIIVLVIISSTSLWYLNTDKNQTNVPENNATSTETVIENENSETYYLDTNNSQINWTGGKRLVLNYFDSGNIKIKEGNIRISETKLSGGKIVFDMTSITATSTGRGSGESNLVNHLKSDDFFSVANYPESTYEVTNVNDLGDNKYRLNGNLTIKNKTAPLSIDAVLEKNSNDTFNLIGRVDVDRTNWDIRYGSDKFFDNLGDNVINDIFTLEFNLVANPELQ